MVADALSRRPHICALAEIIGDWRNKIIEEYVRDTWASGVIAGTIHDDCYEVMDELIKFQGRIYLIPSAQFREVILKAFHDAPTTGHPGVFRPTSRFVSSSHGKGSRMMFRSMPGSVQFSSRIRESTHILQGCYNLCPF